MRFVFQELKNITSFCGTGASGLTDSVERQRGKEGLQARANMEKLEFKETNTKQPL